MGSWLGSAVPSAPAQVGPCKYLAPLLRMQLNVWATRASSYVVPLRTRCSTGLLWPHAPSPITVVCLGPNPHSASGVSWAVLYMPLASNESPAVSLQAERCIRGNIKGSAVCALSSAFPFPAGLPIVSGVTWRGFSEHRLSPCDFQRDVELCV